MDATPLRYFSLRGRVFFFSLFQPIMIPIPYVHHTSTLFTRALLAPPLPNRGSRSLLATGTAPFVMRALCMRSVLDSESRERRGKEGEGGKEIR